MSELTLSLNVTWHADAVKASYLVQAGGFVPAGVGLALVDVQLAASPHEAMLTAALEGAFGVDALPRVLARIRSWRREGDRRRNPVSRH